MRVRNLLYSLLILVSITNCAEDSGRLAADADVNQSDSILFNTALDSGNYFRIVGDLEKAKTFTKSAIELAKNLNWGRGMAKSHTSLAYVNLYESDFEAAMENAVEGLRLGEQFSDLESQGFANLLIGFIYFNLGDTNQVLPYYQKSINIRKTLGDNYDIGFSYSYLGNFYFATKQYDSALYYHNEALKYRLKTDDTRSIADSYLLLGSVYQKKKNYEQALEFMQQALLKYAEISDKKRLAETYRNFAEIYIAQNNYKDAKNFLLQANQLAKETGSIDNMILIADELSKIEYTDSNYQAAYDYLRYHIDTYQKTSGESKYKDIVKNILQYKNEKEKKIKQLEFEQKEERQTLIVISVSTLLLLVVGFLVFMINRLKLTRKQKEIIAVRKHQVDKAYMELEVKNKEILDSITYAKRIQSAILPSDELIKELLPSSFVLYLPKDIVAGDFYWLEQKDNKILFAAADCTGHGVPGAMVSVVCNNSLNRSVHEYGLSEPSAILDKTRELVVSEFEKSSKDMMDGMDIALCSLDSERKILEFAGAYNPLWVIRSDSDEIEEYKADKQPIGKMDHSAPFKNTRVSVSSGDVIYIFSDGYADQFGGENGKKFKSSNLKKLLLSIKHKSMTEQRQWLLEFFKKWQGDHEQVDDVCVLGIRI